MAENAQSREELDLRRRARRRLVGAVALALLAVLILPMVFDPEQQPLSANVDIHIPPQEMGPDETRTSVPPPIQTPSPVTAPTAVQPAPVDEHKSARESATEAATARPPEATDRIAKAAQTPPAPVKPGAAGSNERDGADAAKAKGAVAAPVPAPPKEPAATAPGSYYLQLGSFSKEIYATQMIGKAKAAGFKASAAPIDGQYKVRIGPVGDRGKAMDYHAQLRAKGFDPVLVNP